MKNFIFNNQQKLILALEIAADAAFPTDYDKEMSEGYYELVNLGDEISCIGRDVEQLDYVMIDLIGYLAPSAKKVLKAVIKSLKAGQK